MPSRGATERKAPHGQWRSLDLNDRSSQEFMAAISGMIDAKLNHGISQLMQTNLQ